MKKDFAIQQMGGIKPLADLLGIVRQAIYQWGEDVPKLRAYQLSELRPDLFPPEGEMRRAMEAAVNNSGERSMNDLIIVDVAIRQDAEGRFCLNDLHRASGGESKHQPSNWLRLDQTKALCAEIDRSSEMRNAVQVLRGGSAQGTYVAKELVYAYAMWISPAFNLKVIRAYDGMQAKALHQRTVLMVEQERHIAEQGRQIAEQGRQIARITVIEDRIKRNEAVMDDTVKRYEAKIAAFEEGTRFYTVFAYAYHRGITAHLSISEAVQVNKRASELSKEKGCFIDKVRDPRWGLVNAYHQDVLEAVFEELLSV